MRIQKKPIEKQPIEKQATQLIFDCVSDLSRVNAVLKLVDARMWDAMGESNAINEFSDSYFALELAKNEVERVMTYMAEFPTSELENAASLKLTEERIQEAA